jgi:hypothetical protein
MSAKCDVIAMEDREDIAALERFQAEDDGFRIWGSLPDLL